jgi:hypothetical protein
MLTADADGRGARQRASQKRGHHKDHKEQEKNKKNKKVIRKSVAGARKQEAKRPAQEGRKHESKYPPTPLAAGGARQRSHYLLQL